MSESTPATPITAEQIAELKEALANATKGEWKIIAFRETQTRTSRAVVLLSRDDGTDADANSAYVKLALQSVPSLIAAAEEAGRLRGDFDKSLVMIGEMAMAFPNTPPMVEWPAEIKRLAIEEKDAKALRAELFHLTAERDAAFAAGRKEGLEKAAAHFDKQADDASVLILNFHPAGEAWSNAAKARGEALANAAAIRALIDAPSEEPAGEGHSGNVQTIDVTLPDGRNDTLAIIREGSDAPDPAYEALLEEALGMFHGAKKEDPAGEGEVERLRRQNAAMRDALMAYDNLSLIIESAVRQDQLAFSGLVIEAIIGGRAALAGLDAPTAPEPSALAEARQTIAEAVKIIKPMAYAYGGEHPTLSFSWSGRNGHECATIDLAAARAFVDKHGGTDKAAKGDRG